MTPYACHHTCLGISNDTVADGNPLELVLLGCKQEADKVGRLLCFGMGGLGSTWDISEKEEDILDHERSGKCVSPSMVVLAQADKEENEIRKRSEMDCCWVDIFW